MDFTLLLVMQGLLRYRRTVDIAEELGLSQPAISHALRRLRELFGDPLFIRRPHGLAPTHHALALAPLVESMLDQAHDAVGLARQFDPASSTRDFRIASPDLMGPLVVPPLLKAFERMAPRARFALRTLVGEEALRALRQDQLDLAVGQFRSEIEDVEVEDLYEDEYVLVSRTGHPSRGQKLTAKLFETLSFVTISAAGDFRGLVEDELGERGLTRRTVATVPRFPTALDVVRRTDAVVLAPRRLAETFAGPFRLELRGLPVKLRPMRLMLVRRRNRDPGRDWLADTLKKLLSIR